MISAVLHSEKKTPKLISNKSSKTDQTSIEDIPIRLSSKYQQQNDINLKIEVNPLNLFLINKQSPKMSNSESQQQQQQHPRYAQKKYSSAGGGSRERAYLDRYGYDIWKRTPNTTPTSTVLNSPDLHDMETKHISSFQHHQVAIDSPNSSHRNSPLPSNLTKDGEVVVFDDIADDWRKIQEKFNQEESSSNNSQITKMIGVLPITEYEGSPRRFGNIHYDDDEVESGGGASSSMAVHRLPSLLASPTSSLGAISSTKKTPGFPKRVLSKSQIDESNLLEKNSTFDYLYEFSETRKVLEEFFKCPGVNENCGYEQNCDYNDSEVGSLDHIQCNPLNENSEDNSYIGERLSQLPNEEFTIQNSPRQTGYDHNEIELYFDSGSRSSGDLVDMDCMDPNMRRISLSPGTTDYDSNCGDLDSLSNDLINGIGSEYARVYTSMPVLEDGLSSGHSSDNENNNPNPNCDFDHLASVVANKLIESPQHKSAPGIAQRAELLITTDDSVEPNRLSFINLEKQPDVETALKDIRSTLQRTKLILESQEEILGIENDVSNSPIWVQRCNSHESLESEENIPSKTGVCCDDEEADTDLETDRLLGQQRLDDQGFYDEKSWNERKSICSQKSPQNFNSATIYQGNSILPNSPESAISADETNDNKDGSPQNLNKDTDEKNRPTRNKEGRWEPQVLIEGVLFRAKYLGSTQLVCEGQPTKTTRMMQAEEAVSRIKAPEGESQPSTEVDLFISTEKIMVLNTDLKEIMMDHALRTISYIADIGDLVVLMARRRFVSQDNDDSGLKPNRTPKMICHVFESEEAQFIAQSIGQAFQVAYMEFLKANGIEDHSFVKEMDYQEVLNSQEIFGDELAIFAKKELQKEVVVPKAKGEILGVVIVESGWGSMLPTVVIANLLSTGSAARCGQLNIGDQIIAINGLSLVGLPLSTCQNYIRNSKNQTAVKFTVVPCPPVVEVKIKRPNTKYQLGFSVQNGVICSLLRGGIAERGGVRVGHRIIEINNQSVVAVPHEKIVNLLATSVGEILMKTMPTSMFRLLTGQENPAYI